MTKQFTPSDRESVMQAMDEQDYVFQTRKLGPGIVALCHAWEDDNVRAFTDLMEMDGWYVASIDTDENGDRFTFMPVNEVPDA